MQKSPLDQSEINVNEKPADTKKLEDIFEDFLSDQKSPTCFSQISSYFSTKKVLFYEFVYHAGTRRLFVYIIL